MPSSVSCATQRKYAVALPVAEYVCENGPCSTGARNRSGRLPVVSFHAARVAHRSPNDTAIESSLVNPPTGSESRRPVVDKPYCTGGTTSNESTNTAESAGFAVSLTTMVSAIQPVGVVGWLTMLHRTTSLPVPLNVVTF